MSTATAPLDNSLLSSTHQATSNTAVPFIYVRPSQSDDPIRASVASRHTGNTVLSLTFGADAAIERALWLIIPLVRRMNKLDEPISTLILNSYRPRQAFDSSSPGLPAGSIAFVVPEDSAIHRSDIYSFKDPSSSSVEQCCVLDIQVQNPTRIIPTDTVHVPRALKNLRFLKMGVDMLYLPLWFIHQDELAVGVSITAETYDSIPDTPTRIGEGTQLKIKLAVSSHLGLLNTHLLINVQWSNYRPIEKKIKFSRRGRTTPERGHTLRRLASSVAGAVKTAMNVSFFLKASFLSK